MYLKDVISKVDTKWLKTYIVYRNALSSAVALLDASVAAEMLLQKMLFRILKSLDSS